MRGFLKGCSPASSWASTTFWKLFTGMYTSPRTSKRGRGSGSFSGTDRMVRMFSLTSSPVKPLPRVEPIASTPSRYSRETERPSIFGSTT